METNPNFPVFDWCKKFDTKEPYISTERSIGTDLFVPKFTDEFIEELASVNGFKVRTIKGGMAFMSKDFESNIEKCNAEKERVIESLKKELGNDEDNLERSLKDIEGRYANVQNLILRDSTVCVVDDERTKLIINKLCIVPTGILIDCPEDYWYEVRRKSSSNRNNRRVMLGTIDEDYTYSIGVELKPDDGRKVILTPDEKFAQIVFHKKVLTWGNSHEISYADFVEKDSVKEKRTMRTGGWGSTNIN